MRAWCYDLTHIELDMVLLGSWQLQQTPVRRSLWSLGTWKGRGKKPIQLSTMPTRLHTTTGRRPSQELNWEWAHTTHTREHTQMTQTLTAFRDNWVCHISPQLCTGKWTFLLGRIPGYSHSDIKLLPSSISKRSIWKTYHSTAKGNGIFGRRCCNQSSSWSQGLTSVGRAIRAAQQFFVPLAALKWVGPAPSKRLWSTFVLSR